MYYVVKYSGPFGFIKPWTAVRDSETRPISDGFKKNNVNYWVFRDLCSIILHS